MPGAVVLPHWVLDAVAVAPGGAAPSYAHGYYDRDNTAYRAWDAISRDRDAFTPVARGPAGGGVSTAPGTWTGDEMMSVAAARSLRDGQVCFVGIGLPSTAANLARRLHAPDLVLIYESGTLDTRPDELPLSIGDGILADSALSVVSVPEIFNYWLQPGRIDVGFLSGAQLDRFGNINTTVIGEYDEPDVRLPGIRRRPGDRGVLPRGHRRDAPQAAGVRRAGRLRHLGGPRQRPRRPRRCSACAAPGPSA